MNITKFNQFINEEKTTVIVYFFHPSLTYNTRVEEQSIELIDLYFDKPLIYNTPNTKKGYYDTIDEINTLVVLPHSDGSISPKTYRRIAYSFDRGISIYYLHPQRYKLINIEELDFFTKKTLSRKGWEEKNKTDNTDNYFLENEF